MIGKTILYDDSLRVTVAGIVDDWDRPSDFGYTDFISLRTAPKSFLKNNIPTDDWTSLQPHHSMAFVKLARGTTADQVNAAIDHYIKEHVKIFQANVKLSMYLQPLKDIHFTADFHRGDDGDDFRKAYLPTLYILMGLSLFILILASINFINLSTAQSFQRAREIGIRKIMGSKKSSLVLVFLTETLILTCCATLIAVLFVRPVLFIFKDYIPSGVEFHFFQPATILFLLLVIFITTLLAGFYPAWILSAFSPVQTLRGIGLPSINGRSNLRKTLIVFQFILSLGFIIGALIVGKQIRFMRDTYKGFRSDGIVTISNWGANNEKIRVFADEIRKIAGVSRVILQGNAPMGLAHSQTAFIFKGKQEISQQVSIEMGDSGFIPFYGFKMDAGRNMLPGIA